MTIAPAIQALAREIGASYEPVHGTPRFLARYVAALAEQIPLATRREDEPHSPHPAAAGLARLFAAAAHRAAAQPTAAREAMRQAAEDAIATVDAIDSDDGWPRCTRLYGLKCCALALEQTLRDPERTRWAAEAGMAVAALAHPANGRQAGDARQQHHAYVRGIYGQAARETARAAMAA